MAESVCAVVVTFNRKGLLQLCLEELLKQSRPVDHIVVVNNGSNDGTAEMLASDFPQLQVLHLGENSGGAGGFKAGMQFAYSAGFDWMWVMDDDLASFPGTLECMLGYKDLSDFIHVRRDSASGIFNWEGIWDIAASVRRMLPEEVSFQNGKSWTAVNSGNFEGALIHRRVVDKIGYPDPRFFMCYDDSIYGFLASLYTNVIYVNHVGFTRLQPVRPGIDLNKLYFVHRNRFLVFEYMRRSGVPVSRISFWLHTFLLIANLLKEDRQARTVNCVRTLFRGIGDGAGGRYGRPAWL